MTDCVTTAQSLAKMLSLEDYEALMHDMIVQYVFLGGPDEEEAQEQALAALDAIERVLDDALSQYIEEPNTKEPQ